MAVARVEKDLGEWMGGWVTICKSKNGKRKETELTRN